MKFLQDDLATLRQAWFLRNLLGPEALVRGLMLPLGQPLALWSNGRAPLPVALGWFLTWACDEACVFCNVMHPGRGAAQALSPEERRRILDRVLPPVRIVGLGGGEPLLVDDLADTIRHVHRLGATVFVPTNGAALDDDTVRSFASAAPEVVAVTLIGDESTHDAATRRPGSWKRTVAGVSRLLETRNPRKTRVILNCPLSPTNGGCLDEVVQTGRRLGVDRVRFTWVSFTDTGQVPGTDAGEDCAVGFVPGFPQSAGASVSDLAERSLSTERAQRGFVTFQPRLDVEERRAWFHAGGGVRRRCSSLWNTVYLRPDGQVVPCGQRLGEAVGSLLVEELAAIWDQPRLRRLRLDQREHPLARLLAVLQDIMKAKVGLIFPRFRYPSGDAPLGVACLAAWLRTRLPVHVAVCDTTFAPSLATIRRFLLREHPDILGVGLSTLMLGEASAAARLAHAMGIPVFMGGPHATVDPRGVMGWEGVQGVVIGEGEVSGEELVRMFLESGGRPDRRHEVPGCLVRGTGGRLLQGPARAPLGDLDALPLPAWDLLDMDSYLAAWGQLDGVRPGLRGVNLMAGRGCAHTCAFCQPMVARLFGARPRFRSPEHVLREIRDLDTRFRIDGFWFTDDTFASDPEWLESFCQGLERFGRPFVWGCNTRAGLLSREVLARLASVGLRRLGVGLESASDRIREGLYHKGVTLEDAARTARDAADLGISTLAFAMLGAPGETRREMLLTIETVTSMPFREASFSLFVPIPGTAIYDDMKKRGVPLSDNYTDYDYYARQPFPNEVGAIELRALQRWAYVRFYSHPSRLGSIRGTLLEPAGRRSLGRKLRRILPRGVPGPIGEREVETELRRLAR